MSDLNPSSSSPTQARSKHNRNKTIGVVLTTGATTGPDLTDGLPSTKRSARLPINCKPCRKGKLKCDRKRPCSSCVLRGKLVLVPSALWMCHYHSRSPSVHEGSDPNERRDDQHFHIDPAQEFPRLRHCVSRLEAYLFPNQRQTAPMRRVSDVPPLIIPRKEAASDEQGTTVPDILSIRLKGGLYAGPTSAATHLIINEDRDVKSESGQHSQDHASDDFAQVSQDYDRNLLSLLPSIETIDILIDYYFEYCNWIYRYVDQPSFMQQWEKYKTGVKADWVVLATACALMAIATHYLPSQHALLDKFSSESNEKIGLRFFDVSTVSLKKHNAESKSYTLELVELLLVRTHFHSLSTTETEEIWHAQGELVAIGTAMGLHRDPGKWRMQRDIAERRRWAWWHIVLLERWQAFFFGRPLFIASHHSDTLLPSYCDPALDKTGRLYLPNIAFFHLASIIGDIMDDAVSLLPVPYESVQTNDRSLRRWMESLPQELDMTELRVAESLASPDVAIRRLGVQSVIIRTSYYHIRFTLHRPYASPRNITTYSSKLPIVDPANLAQSLEIAIGAADKLITLVGDFSAMSSIAVPGHMIWQPFHCFSATMFFSFELIANPEQPGAGLIRANIRKAITTLEQASLRGIAVADKALDILQALCPLHSTDFLQESTESRKEKISQILRDVRKLAFPYHDSHDTRRLGDSPGTRGAMSSPANAGSLITPMPVFPALPQHSYDQIHNSLSMRNDGIALYQKQTYNSAQAHPQAIHSPEDHSQIIRPYSQTLTSTPVYQNYDVSQQLQPTYDPIRYGCVQPVDDGSMWYASIGHGHAERSHFLDNTQTQGGPSNRNL